MDTSEKGPLAAETPSPTRLMSLSPNSWHQHPSLLLLLLFPAHLARPAVASCVPVWHQWSRSAQAQWSGQTADGTQRAHASCPADQPSDSVAQNSVAQPHMTAAQQCYAMGGSSLRAGRGVIEASTALVRAASHKLAAEQGQKGGTDQRGKGYSFDSCNHTTPHDDSPPDPR